jgi:hypothetical protein
MESLNINTLAEYTSFTKSDVYNTVTHLTFDDDFNHPVILPDQLQSVKFGYYFNKPINSLYDIKTKTHVSHLPKSIVSVIFGFNFNQPLVLPNGLVTLETGVFFNKPLTLPKSLVNLTLGAHYDQPITVSSKVNLQCLNHYGKKLDTLRNVTIIN